MSIVARERLSKLRESLKQSEVNTEHEKILKLLEQSKATEKLLQTTITIKRDIPEEKYLK